MSQEPKRIVEEALSNMIGDYDDSDDVWSAFFPTNMSVFRADNLLVLSIELSGKGSWKSESSLVSIRLLYRLSHKGCIKTTHWVVKGISEAIDSLLSFMKNKEVCRECGRIKPKSSACNPCEFFKAFCKANDKEVDCAICMEKVYRLMLSCGHSFHLTCLSNINDDKCPMCRHQLSNEEYEYIFGEEDDCDDMEEESIS